MAVVWDKNAEDARRVCFPDRLGGVPGSAWLPVSCPAGEKIQEA
jgi:hypothetical protein